MVAEQEHTPFDVIYVPEQGRGNSSGQIYLDITGVETALAEQIYLVCQRSGGPVRLSHEAVEIGGREYLKAEKSHPKAGILEVKEAVREVAAQFIGQVDLVALEKDDDPRIYMRVDKERAGYSDLLLPIIMDVVADNLAKPLGTSFGEKDGVIYSRSTFPEQGSPIKVSYAEALAAIKMALSPMVNASERSNEGTVRSQQMQRALG